MKAAVRCSGNTAAPILAADSGRRQVLPVRAALGFGKHRATECRKTVVSAAFDVQIDARE
jgi:hypothetical protein